MAPVCALFGLVGVRRFAWGQMVKAPLKDLELHPSLSRHRDKEDRRRAFVLARPAYPRGLLGAAPAKDGSPPRNGYPVSITRTSRARARASSTSRKVRHDGQAGTDTWRAGVGTGLVRSAGSDGDRVRSAGSAAVSANSAAIAEQRRSRGGLQIRPETGVYLLGSFHSVY